MADHWLRVNFSQHRGNEKRRIRRFWIFRPKAADDDMNSSLLKLGVNIDHAATVRQARGTDYPNIVAIAQAAEDGGADAITVHLREDRRHIQDCDVFELQRSISTHLNLELAATDEMVDIACRLKPRACCIVPERRAELTTEGGLDAVGLFDRLQLHCRKLSEAGIEVALFLDPELKQIECAANLGVPTIELHTGTYASAPAGSDQAKELETFFAAVTQASARGLRVNAGHGLHYDNVAAIAAIDEINELNIGHSIVAAALFCGVEDAVRRMQGVLRGARQ